MASFVTAADALAAAVEIEARGRKFYENLAEIAQEKDRAFFIEMAGEEVAHEEVFKGMLKRIGGLPLPPGCTDEDYLLYVQDLLDSHCLFIEGFTGRALESPLDSAIQLEKDTMLFFQELEKMVPKAEQKHVRECAQEEMKHLRMLIVKKQAR
jgi:Uncharacterized conserved protein